MHGQQNIKTLTGVFHYGIGTPLCAVPCNNFACTRVDLNVNSPKTSTASLIVPPSCSCTQQISITQRNSEMSDNCELKAADFYLA